VLLIFLSYSSIILYINREKPVENGKDSIYTGYTPSQIASNLAKVLGKEELLRTETERHAKIWTWNRFYYENLSIEIVLQRQQAFWWPDGEPITIRIKDESPQSVPANSTDAENIVFTLWNKILRKFDCDLNDTGYAIISNSTDIESKRWKIEIRQTFNDGLPLMNTGIITWVDKNSSGISTIEMYEWLDTKIMEPIIVPLSTAQEFLMDNINARNRSVMHSNLTSFSSQIHGNSTSTIVSSHTTSMYDVTINNSSDMKLDGYTYTLDKIYYIIFFEELTIEKGRLHINRFYYYINIENGDCMLGPVHSG
jgi:hypothetical protein